MPIVVSLSAENDAIEIVRSREFTVDPPASNQPRTGFFTVKGVHPGVSRLAVAFRQGGSELGVIRLAVEVVQAGASAEKAKGHAVAAPRDVADDDKLALLVEQRVEGGQVFDDTRCIRRHSACRTAGCDRSHSWTAETGQRPRRWRS